MLIMDFGKWFDKEIQDRELSQNKVAKLIGVTQGAIAHVIHGRRNPGPDMLEGIAKVLGYPPELVFRKAGLLPPAPERTEQIEILIYLFDKLPEKDRVELLDYMKIKLIMVSK